MKSTRKAKGSMLKPIVIGIRADKSGTYDNLLSEEDKQVIYSKILDSAWYPYDTYKNAFNAVTKIFAKGNMEIVRKWGRERGRNTIERMYRTQTLKRDLDTAVNLYERFFNLWFNFGSHRGEIISENEANIIIEDFDPDFEVFYYTAAGWIETAFNLLMGKKINTKFLAKSWKGDKETIINIIAF